MNTTLYVTIREVYGEPKVYPACDQARRLAELAGHKTLTKTDLRLLREMGFEIVESPFNARHAAALATV